STGMVYEAEHVKRSGEHFPVEISTISIDIDGKQHLQKIIRDITERKQAEQQLLKLTEELEARVVLRTNEVVDVSSKLDGFFRVSIDLLCIFNKDSYFVKLNPSWSNLLGYTQEELLSRKITDFIHPDDVESAENTIRELFKEVIITHYITRFRSKDGSYKFLEWNASAAGDFIYAAVHDITESKKTEDEIMALNSVLVNTNRELESFSYSVSHDLRAPLRSMEGYSSALRTTYAEKLDEQGMHYLDRIQNAAIRMSSLINDLLELSQLGQKQLTMQMINLSDIAAKISVELKEANPTQQISFRISEKDSVMADSDLMKIVLKNLLDNARKFSSKRDISEVVFSTKKDAGQTVYFVQDNGEGFEMEYADKLFTPFQRYHHASDFAGTGIGLSIVFRVITRHKGKVWVESDVDKGTTVYFTLNAKGD
ncbi:MAG: PAS domain S-box protein, partial [Candidatus Cloacimonadaceae bacterium]|nr:PAS domain S-box protein [Candidatus Cloacimonadaceae bacterium]